MLGAETLAALVKTLGNAVAAKINPMGGVKNFTDSISGGKDTSDGGKTSSSSNKSKADDSSEKDKNADTDLALIYCGMVTKPVEAMVDILSGPDGVIWELVSDIQSKADKKKDNTGLKGKWNVEMIKTMLQRTKGTIRSSKTDRNTANAKTLLSAINDTLKVRFYSIPFGLTGVQY